MGIVIIFLFFYLQAKNIFDIGCNGSRLFEHPAEWPAKNHTHIENTHISYLTDSKTQLRLQTMAEAASSLRLLLLRFERVLQNYLS